MVEDEVITMVDPMQEEVEAEILATNVKHAIESGTQLSHVGIDPISNILLDQSMNLML